jgi:hypothetical protein
VCVNVKVNVKCVSVGERERQTHRWRGIYKHRVTKHRVNKETNRAYTTNAKRQRARVLVLEQIFPAVGTLSRVGTYSFGN